MPAVDWSDFEAAPPPAAPAAPTNVPAVNWSDFEAAEPPKPPVAPKEPSTPPHMDLPAFETPEWLEKGKPPPMTTEDWVQAQSEAAWKRFMFHPFNLTGTPGEIVEAARQFGPMGVDYRQIMPKLSEEEVAKRL